MKKKNYIQPEVEAMVLLGEGIMKPNSPGAEIEPTPVVRRRDGKVAVF
ncbi:MAG: hypothetical protein IJ718_02750 [Paludibacteraceae bacterium]|nr:hypothetical protein [Paludibacteraceae bacterium]